MANSYEEFTFEIVDNLGVISTYPTGWTKELNLVSWNGGVPKYDIRDWNPDHTAMSRGITLHEKEIQSLVDYFSGYEFMKNHSGENK